MRVGNGLTAGLALGALTIVFGASAAYTYGTADNVTVQVNEKERIMDRDGRGSRYLVYGDNEVFENTDSLLKLKFNSSDVYRQLEEGQSYDCDVYGMRVPVLSWYRNIVDCQPAVKNEAPTL